MNEIPSPEDFIKRRGKNGANNRTCCKAGDLPPEIREKVDANLDGPYANPNGLSEWLRLYYPEHIVSSDTLRKHAKHSRIYP